MKFLRVSIKFKWNDLWIGIYIPKKYSVEECVLGRTLWTQVDQYMLYICIIPCFPILLEFERRHKNTLSGGAGGAGGSGSNPEDNAKGYSGAPPKTTGLTFGEALEAMKAGKRVRLPSWEYSVYYFFSDCKIRLTVEKIYNEAMCDIPTYEVLSTDWEIVE